MAHLYFTRHGQTFWNVENKICGATDIGLTELGHSQAKELGEKILQQGIHIDEILYSPLSRAADTAKHISRITGIPMRKEKRRNRILENMNQQPEMVKNLKWQKQILYVVLMAVKQCYTWHKEYIIC